jgi:hypothetical protein
MAVKLDVVNAALLEVGAQRLASLTEVRESRFIIDTIYDGVVEDCLEAAAWNFASREIRAVSDTGVTENFGFTETIGKPTDWVRTVRLADNESYWPPLHDHQCRDIANFWETNVSPIFVIYVSNDAGYGLDLTRWPRSFTRFVEVSIADRIMLRLSQNKGSKERLERVTLPRARRDAINKDAMAEGMKFRSVSTWNAARGSGSTRERGSTTSFTG